MENLKAIETENYIPVFVVTAESSRKLRALQTIFLYAVTGLATSRSGHAGIAGSLRCAAGLCRFFRPGTAVPAAAAALIFAATHKVDDVAAFDQVRRRILAGLVSDESARMRGEIALLIHRA